MIINDEYTYTEHSVCAKYYLLSRFFLNMTYLGNALEKFNKIYLEDVLIKITYINYIKNIVKAYK